MTRFDYDTDEINERLRLRATELCSALGLSGKLHYANYWVKDFRRKDGGNLSSMSVNIQRGIWKNFAGPSDEGGDLLRLVAVFACRGDNTRSIPWALDWLGLTDRKPDPAETKRLMEEARKVQADEMAKAEKRRRQAKAIWLSGKPLDGTDPASMYLKYRGIDVTKLPGGPPRALRWTRDCYAWPEDERRPAMLAIVSGREGAVSCHRTYLECITGIWTKAWAGKMRDGKKVAAKRALGEFVGGSIRLTRGVSGKPLAKAPPEEWPAIGEGIENVLTAALACPELRCLSSVSGSNLGNVVLPPQVKGVYLLADNDEEPQAKAMFERAMDNFIARGIEPVVVRASGVKDLNDLIKRAS